MANHVGFGVPGMHSERLDAERVAKMRSDVPAEEREHSPIPSFGVGTGHSSAKSRGSREVHSQKEQLDLQHTGHGESSASERQPLMQPSGSTSSGGRNEILEQHGAGVATFNEPGANREHEGDRHYGGNKHQHGKNERQYGGNDRQSAGRCPFGGSQALQGRSQLGDDRQRGDDRSFGGDDQFGYDSQRGDDNSRGGDRQQGSGRHEVYAKDSDLGATRKATVPLGNNDSVPMVSPPTSQLNTAAPYNTAATMKSSQYNSNDPTELQIHHHP